MLNARSRCCLSEFNVRIPHLPSPFLVGFGRLTVYNDSRSFTQMRTRRYLPLALPARRFATLRTFFPAVLLALFLTATTGYSFTALYALGDSLSDTGRNPAPPTNYFNGRYSNGPLWVEYLSGQLGLLYNPTNNFAVSGSATADLASQLAGLTPSPDLASALFTVWSGANDFKNNVTLGTDDAGWSNVIAAAVLNLTNTIDALYTDGAREVLVPNLPNLGETPALSGQPGSFRAYIDTKVASFNNLLAAALTNSMQRNPGLRIYPLDANSLFARLISTPATFGITVTTNGALEDPNLTDKSFTGPGANYLFWDTLHPTTKVHALIAALAYQGVGVQLNLARNGTNFNLTILNLEPGLPYTIQSSTNITIWSDTQTLTAASTNATVVATNGPGSRAFYRVRY
jgi:phospholipase/lecithinase/hemolysin